MDSSQSKSLSLNLDLPDLFARLSHLPVSNFTSTKQIFRDSDLKLSTEYTSQAYNEMSHFLSMADARSEMTISKKNSNIFRTMINALGSFANAVSKLPNYMMNINNPLSVTVVPNGGIISSEYLLKNLTRKKEHLSTCIDSSTNILECVKNKTHQNKLPTTKLEFSGMQHMNSTLNETLFGVCSKLPKTWMESIIDTNDNLEQCNLPHSITNSQIAILESIKLMNNIEHCSKIDDMSNPENITRDIGKFNSSLCPKINMSEKTTENIPQINDNLLDETETTTRCNELLNSKESMKRSFPKTIKKCNTIARARSKRRGKVQLRKSGVSQLKHRKNSSKHNIYSNIQSDIDDWERDQENSSEMFSEDCVSSTSTSTVDYDFKQDKVIDEFQIIHSNYPSLICTSSQLNQPKSTKIMEKKILESPLQSPKHDMSVNFRSRHPSDNSIDSEDSCSIVFQDKSESECSTDYDSESSCTEDESDDDIDHKMQQVRFTIKPTIHKMIKWDFAYRAARIGPWEQAARDRERFYNRINCVGKILDPMLLASHRERIYQNRFMDKIDLD